jgi:DNA-binding IclR family transcriptional regulator
MKNREAVNPTRAVSGEGEERSRERNRVPGLERGLCLLAEFSPREPVLGAPELSRRLGLPRMTVFRLLHTLESLHFIERVGRGRTYRPGVAALRLGFDYLGSLEIVNRGQSVIEALRDATGLSAGIAVRDGGEFVYVAEAPGFTQTSIARAAVGTRVSTQAMESGVPFVAAPVRNDTSCVRAVVAATLPGFDLSASLPDRGLIDKVCDAAAELSRRLLSR